MRIPPLLVALPLAAASVAIALPYAAHESRLPASLDGPSTVNEHVAPDGADHDAADALKLLRRSGPIRPIKLAPIVPAKAELEQVGSMPLVTVEQFNALGGQQRQEHIAVVAALFQRVYEASPEVSLCAVNAFLPSVGTFVPRQRTEEEYIATVSSCEQSFPGQYHHGTTPYADFRRAYATMLPPKRRELRVSIGKVSASKITPEKVPLYNCFLTWIFPDVGDLPYPGKFTTLKWTRACDKGIGGPRAVPSGKAGKPRF